MHLVLRQCVDAARACPGKSVVLHGRIPRRLRRHPGTNALLLTILVDQRNDGRAVEGYCMAEQLDAGLQVVAQFEIRRRRYIGPDGTVVAPLPDFASQTEIIVSFYRAMVLARAFDLKAVSLQRTGRLGAYAVSLGQEAAAVGVASAMRREDVLLPSYRDNAALIWRGVKMEEILLYWGGDERGNISSGPAHDFPYC